MRRAVRMARHVFIVAAVASAGVAAAVASNQILNGDKWALTWAGWAFGFTVFGTVLATAWEKVEPSPRRVSRRKYRRRVWSSVEQMETVGLVTQAEYVLRTRQVYVDVALQPQPVTQATSDTGVGEPANSDGRQAGQRAPLASFLAPGRVLAVLGAAGSGKTTLARYTALDLAERKWLWRRRFWQDLAEREWVPWRRRFWEARFWRRRPLPILLYLRDHAEAILTSPGEETNQIGLAQAAAAAPWLEGVIAADWLDRHLSKGRCVVLLDGLDEVADGSDRKRVVDWAERQISRYRRNAFVVTSRPHGYEDNRLSNAEVLRVQRFAISQIRDFLEVWYRAIERRARQGDRTQIDRDAAGAAHELFDRIVGLPALYDLAANPLLLTMIANVHRYGGQLPAGRAALYAEICLVLVHRRQDVRNIVIDPKVDALTGPQKQLIVQELAWHMMRYKSRDIPVTDACSAIRAVLRRADPDLSPEAFLEYARRSGLLTEHRHGHYGFVHLTLQEHLAATSALAPRYTARRQHLIANVTDSWWRETILLWAASADASPVVEACLNARTAPALSLAFALDDQALELDPDLRDQLSQLLATTPSSPQESLLLDGIAFDRLLHRSYTLPGGTRLCTTPVSNDLWNRYTTHKDIPSIRPGTPQAASGADIHGLVTWTSTLNPDIPYRLPTPDEARQALAGDHHSDLTAIWAQASLAHDLSLIPRPDQPHPHLPTNDQINNLPGLIIRFAWPLILLICRDTTPSLGRLLRYGRLRDSTHPTDRLIHALDLAYALDLASESNAPIANRALDMARDLAHDLGLERFDFQVARNLAVTVARDLDLDLALARSSAASRYNVGDLVRDFDLALDLALAVDRDLDHALDLDGDLDRARGIRVSDGHLVRGRRARARERGLGRGSELVRDLVRSFARDSLLASEHDLDHTRERALDRDLTLISEFSADRILDLDFSGARVTGAILEKVDFRTQVIFARGYIDLVVRYLVKGGTGSPGRSQQLASVSQFELFLSHELDVLRFLDSPVDDPNAVLDRLVSSGDSADGLPRDVVESLEAARQLTSLLMSRNRTITSADMVFVIVCVLRAISLLNKNALSHREPIRNLIGVLATLIAFVEPGPALAGTGVVLAPV